MARVRCCFYARGDQGRGVGRADAVVHWVRGEPFVGGGELEFAGGRMT